jgi:hypothetical protein
MPQIRIESTRTPAHANTPGRLTRHETRKIPRISGETGHRAGPRGSQHTAQTPAIPSPTLTTDTKSHELTPSATTTRPQLCRARTTAQQTQATLSTRREPLFLEGDPYGIRPDETRQYTGTHPRSTIFGTHEGKGTQQGSQAENTTHNFYSSGTLQQLFTW